jgi:hypothetical protein
VSRSARPGLEPGAAGRYSAAMTWVWAALIAVGVVMIAVALWPGASRRDAAASGERDTADRSDDH